MTRTTSRGATLPTDEERHCRRSASADSLRPLAAFDRGFRAFGGRPFGAAIAAPTSTASRAAAPCDDWRSPVDLRFALRWTWSLTDRCTPTGISRTVSSAVAAGAPLTWRPRAADGVPPRPADDDVGRWMSSRLIVTLVRPRDVTASARVTTSPSPQSGDLVSAVAPPSSSASARLMSPISAVEITRREIDDGTIYHTRSMITKIIGISKIDLFNRLVWVICLLERQQACVSLCSVSNVGLVIN